MPKETVSKVTRKTTGGAVAAKKTSATATTTTASSATTAADDRTAMGPPTAEMVAARAYEIYLEEGRPEGRQLEHWVRAETELLKN
jgi:hypothetical protein